MSFKRKPEEEEDEENGEKRKRKSRFDEGGPSKWDQGPSAEARIALAAAAAGRLPTGAAAPAAQTSKYITIPLGAVGGLIGHGGSVIRQLMQDTGTKVEMQRREEMTPGVRERGVTLRGSPSGIAEVELKVLEIVAASTPAGGLSGGGAPAGGGSSDRRVVLVPNLTVGSIIGKAGATIKTLIQDSGARFDIQPKEEMQAGAQEREITITGTSEQIEKGAALIMGVVENAQKLISGGNSTAAAAAQFSAPPSPYAMASPYAQPMLGIGPAAPQSDYGQASAPPSDYGPPTSAMITVPDGTVGSIIGKQGAVIKRLIADSGAQFEIQPKEDMRPGQAGREVTITGTAGQIEKATMLIHEVVDSATRLMHGVQDSGRYNTQQPQYGAYGADPYAVYGGAGAQVQQDPYASGLQGYAAYQTPEQQQQLQQYYAQQQQQAQGANPYLGQQQAAYNPYGMQVPPGQAPAPPQGQPPKFPVPPQPPQPPYDPYSQQPN